jgi:hypothetical protein
MGKGNVKGQRELLPQRDAAAAAAEEEEARCCGGGPLVRPPAPFSREQAPAQVAAAPPPTNAFFPALRPKTNLGRPTGDGDDDDERAKQHRQHEGQLHAGAMPR